MRKKWCKIGGVGGWNHPDLLLCDIKFADNLESQKASNETWKTIFLGQEYVSWSNLILWNVWLPIII